jgi:hypothetical protein
MYGKIHENLVTVFASSNGVVVVGECKWEENVPFYTLLNLHNLFHENILANQTFSTKL